MASTSIVALDARRRAGTSDSASWIVGSIVIIVLVGLGLFFGDADLGDATPLETAIVVLKLSAGLSTAYLVYSHAASSRNRAYLALASTFMAVGWAAGGLLLVTDGGLIAGEQLIGTPQAAPWTTFFLQTILPVGVCGTAGIMWYDARSYRRPGRGTHVAASVGSSALVLVVAGALILGLGDNLPVLLDADGMPTDAWWWAWGTCTCAAIAALVAVLALGTARYSIVAGWMIGVASLTLASSMVYLGGPSEYSLAWLVAELLCLLSVLLMPYMMLSQLGRVERTARRVADEDMLTGLTSRSGLLARLEHEVERAKALGRKGALLWVDLDGFKALNDQLGHAKGDEALRTVATRLRLAARPNDTVARLAGDEFGMLVADLGDPGDADTIARRALDALREPVMLDEASPLLTASIGIVHFPDDDDDADNLLHLADLAMYEAKREGGDCLATFDQPMAERAQALATDRQRLARAIREDTFELHYQPLSNLGSGEHIGSEALLRWIRSGEVVAAGDFVPMAETNGQIRQLGRVVLDLLTRDLQEAEPLPAGFRVAVNLSVPELSDPDVSASLCEGELSSFLPNLTIEVTEGVMLTDHPGAVEHLRCMRAAGAAIALDDFGSGFANVEALAGLNPDLLKVDSAFTQRAGRGDESGIAFLEAARAIGSAIDAVVLAEGIETAEELEVVKQMGIEFGQGRLLGPPAPGLTV